MHLLNILPAISSKQIVYFDIFFKVKAWAQFFFRCYIRPLIFMDKEAGVHDLKIYSPIFSNQFCFIRAI